MAVIVRLQEAVSMMGSGRQQGRGHCRASTPIALICAVLWISMASGCDGFQSAGQNAAEEIHKTVTDALNRLPVLIHSIDDAAARALQTADAVLSKQISAARDALHTELESLDAALNARIEQGDSALKGRIDQLNAALSARILQITDFAQRFLGDIDGVVQRTIKQLTYTADYLLSKTGRVGTDLIENAGFTVTRTVREGGKVFGYITQSVIETVVVIAALAVLLFLVILAFLYYRRLSDVPPPVRASQWVPGTALLVAFVPLAIGALIPSVRERITASRIEISDDPDVVCPPAIAKAHDFSRAFPHTGSDDAQKAARVVEEKLYECLNSDVASDLRSQALAMLSDLHRALGETKPTCTHNEDCNVPAGEHCDIAHSTCTSRCLVDPDCSAGKVCSGDGKCISPCSSFQQCDHGMICKSGHCSLAPQCSPAETKPCGNSDHAPCRLGAMTCGEDGMWGGCIGNVDPTPQDQCAPGNDSSCDGVAANGFDSGNRSVCQCLLGAAQPACDCPAPCAGLKGSRQCLDGDHQLGACLPCACACAPGAVDNNCGCVGNACTGQRTCDGNGQWGACSCPAPHCPAGFSASGASCVWQGADFGYTAWSVTGTPEMSVFAAINPPPECNVSSDADCVIHFRLRDRGGDCKHNDEQALEVRCDLPGGQVTTINAGEIGNGIEWELACHGRVLFKKLHSAYNWGTKGCVRYADDPRYWRVTTGQKVCQ